MSTFAQVIMNKLCRSFFCITFYTVCCLSYILRKKCLLLTLIINFILLHVQLKNSQSILLASMDAIVNDVPRPYVIKQYVLFTYLFIYIWNTSTMHVQYELQFIKHCVFWDRKAKMALTSAHRTKTNVFLIFCLQCEFCISQ